MILRRISRQFLLRDGTTTLLSPLGPEGPGSRRLADLSLAPSGCAARSARPGASSGGMYEVRCLGCTCKIFGRWGDALEAAESARRTRGNESSGSAVSSPFVSDVAAGELQGQMQFASRGEVADLRRSVARLQLQVEALTRHLGVDVDLGDNANAGPQLAGSLDSTGASQRKRHVSSAVGGGGDGRGGREARGWAERVQQLVSGTSRSHARRRADSGDGKVAGHCGPSDADSSTDGAPSDVDLSCRNSATTGGSAQPRRAPGEAMSCSEQHDKVLREPQRSSTCAPKSTGECTLSLASDATSKDLQHFIGRTLSVHIIRADHLPQMDVTGKADPYVKIMVGEQQRVTKTLKNTLSPQWDERFAVDVESSCRQVVLTLMDWDRFSANEIIGECRIQLADVAEMEGAPLSLPLLKPGTGEAIVGKDRCNSTLELSLSLSPHIMASSPAVITAETGSATTTLEWGVQLDEAKTGSGSLAVPRLALPSTGAETHRWSSSFASPRNIFDEIMQHSCSSSHDGKAATIDDAMQAQARSPAPDTTSCITASAAPRSTDNSATSSRSQVEKIMRI